MKPEKERAHSKFSASGFERIEACPGSVELSEGQPDKSSPWAIEGTEAHEVLEAILLRDRDLKRVPEELKRRPPEMFAHAEAAASFLIERSIKAKSPLMVEDRVSLAFIHPEAFGTLDSSIIELFGTLDIFDYKYGAGYAVSPKENLQMIFYAMAVAHKYHWNFKRIRMWIIQPRIKGYDGPAFWEIPTRELMEYVPRFKKAIDRAIAEPDTYIEGGHCHWCKAKRVCPLKTGKRLDKAKSIFTPVGGDNNGEKEGLKSEAAWREEAGQRKGSKKGSHKEKGKAHGSGQAEDRSPANPFRVADFY